MQYHLVKRQYWLQEIKNAWEHRSIIWLTGVRRVGKTYLCQSIPNIEYFDCELPRVRQLLVDPEEFLKNMQDKYVALDEIHHLDNPSEVLKIAADHYPKTKIIATGSSTLDASRKFRDTLAGRKTQIYLTPMLIHEGIDFGNQDVQHRMLFGGLPAFFCCRQLPESDYQEWLEAYWARDIQELFQLEKRYSFLKFTELVLTQSGSMFEATRFAGPCEASRATISNYLSILESTHVAHVIRPYSTHRSSEIVSAPKVYGFDTGFVCFARGWHKLRSDDAGFLWEHIVLNEIYGKKQQTGQIRYWRDKGDHEVDFIFFKRQNADPVVIECKWKADSFSPIEIKTFRRRYPLGENYVVASDVDRAFQRTYDGVTVQFVSLSELTQKII